MHLNYTIASLALVLMLFTVWRDDFELKDRVIKFDSCETRKCVQVEIVNDDIVEDTETFNIVLDQSHFGLSFDVILEQDSTSILIENDDCMLLSSKNTMV